VLERRQFRAFATSAGVLQIYRADTRDGALVSNSAVLLAYLTGNHSVDTESLAGYLFDFPPTAHAMRPLLAAAHPITTGSEISVCGRTVTQRPFWTPWNSCIREMPFAAEEVHRSLDRAIHARAMHAHSLGCDLSGGLDSTSVAFIAAGIHNALTLYTIEGQEHIGEDRRWSALAAAELGHLNRRVLHEHDTPAILDDLDQHIAPLDRPSFGHPSAARFLATVAHSADEGATFHLNGFGGDQLFIGSPTVIHDSVRTRPFGAWGQLSSITQTHNWKWRDVLSGLRDSRNHKQWWNDQRANVFQPLPPALPHFGWAQPCRLPAWVTPEAATMAQRCLSHMGETPPLGPSRGRSASLESVLACGRHLHTMSQLSAYHGGRPEAPFLDIQVVNAALSADPVQTVTGRSYKPLLRASVRGVVPQQLLSRVSKDAATVEAETGLIRNRDWLQSIWSTSRLAECGLIDGPRLAETCLNPSTDDLRNCAMFATLGCELWLRGVEMIAK
jgi:asparagine synthase (glutamine-hydrolysing)